MKQYLVLFRETDARKNVPDPVFAAAHQQHWADWMKEYKDHLKGGSALTMSGAFISTEKQVSDGPYFTGDEFVGGFLLIEAADLDAANEIVKACPIFEAGGFAEIRELMKQGA